MNNNADSTKNQGKEQISEPLKKQRQTLVWIVLSVSLTLTALAYYYSHEMVDQRLNEAFEFRTNEIQGAVKERMLVYEQALWGGAALFYTSAERDISRSQWADYVNALELEKKWPGIQGLGFSIPVADEDKLAHIKRIREQGFSEYTIKPDGPRAERAVIVYLEPFDWRNKRAFGYDMWSNELRREALSRARDSGEAATTALITLVQETDENTQSGFLTYVPVYSDERYPQTKEARKEQLVGWVYAAFRASDLMTGILADGDRDIFFEIYDGEAIDEKSLLFSNSENQQSIISSSTFTKILPIKLQGRTWTLVFGSADNDTVSKQYRVPILVAFIGFITSSLLFYVIWSLFSVKQRAEKIAHNMTEALQTSKKDLEKQVAERTKALQDSRDELDKTVDLRTKELKQKIAEIEQMNQLTLGREIRVIELKNEVNNLEEKLNLPLSYDVPAVLDLPNLEDSK